MWSLTAGRVTTSIACCRLIVLLLSPGAGPHSPPPHAGRRICIRTGSRRGSCPWGAAAAGRCFSGMVFCCLVESTHRHVLKAADVAGANVQARPKLRPVMRRAGVGICMAKEKEGKGEAKDKFEQVVLACCSERTDRDARERAYVRACARTYTLI